jgi:hypothetical protein
VAAIEAKAYRGKRWVTRPRPHVDRVATAWLIRRFIDPKARFAFSTPASFPRGAIPFDAPGVEFGHHGADCTFETMLKRFRLSRPALTEIGEVVHDIDLGDGRFSRPEARGLDWALRGLLASNPDDHAVLAAGLQLFDGLYATLTGGRR